MTRQGKTDMLSKANEALFNSVYTLYLRLVDYYKSFVKSSISIYYLFRMFIIL